MDLAHGRRGGGAWGSAKRSKPGFGEDVRHRRAFEEFSRVWRMLDGLGTAKRDEKLATSRGACAARAGSCVRQGAGGSVPLRPLCSCALGGVVLDERMGTRIADTGDGSRPTAGRDAGGRFDRQFEYQYHRRGRLDRRNRQITCARGRRTFKWRTMARDRSWCMRAMRWCVPWAPSSRCACSPINTWTWWSTRDGWRSRRRRRDRVRTAGPHAGGMPGGAAGGACGGEAVDRKRGLPGVEITPEELSSEMAWREGAIIFDGEPLSKAIAEIERYTDARIVSAIPKPRRCAWAAAFAPTMCRISFRGPCESALPITIRRAPDGVIYIDSRR